MTSHSNRVHHRHLTPGYRNRTQSVALACIFGFVLLRGWGREKTRAWRKWQQDLPPHGRGLLFALDSGVYYFGVASYHFFCTLVLFWICVGISYLFIISLAIILQLLSGVAQ